MYARFYEQLFWEFWRGGYVFYSCPSSALCPNAQPRVSDMVFKFALLICTKFTSDIRICENCDIPQTERTFFINSEIPQKKLCTVSWWFFHNIVALSYNPLALTLTKILVNGSIYSSLMQYLCHND